jgi:predicted restriction endonuclease
MERILTDNIVQETAPAHTRQTAMVERAVRSATFKRRVLELFDYRCAVCGFSSQSDPMLINGVEAAHVIPVRRAGSDAVDNGIALCVLHHWAFDNGLMSFELDDIHRTLTTVIHPTRAWGIERR